MIAQPTPTEPAPTPTRTPPLTSTPTFTPTPGPTRTPTPTPAPSDSGLAAAAARALAAAALGVPAAQIALESVEQIDWPNPSLGCPQPGVMHAQVIVPGWLIVVHHNGRSYEYHADAPGDRVVTCDPAIVGTPTPAINVAEKASIVDPIRMTVSGILPGGESAELLRVEDPELLRQIVAALNGPTYLAERDPCATLIRLEFKMAKSSTVLTYACSGKGAIIRGDQDFWASNDGLVPVEFQRLVNAVIASRPFPGLPE